MKPEVIRLAFFSILILLNLLLVLALPVSAREILVNPGFEEDSDQNGLPDSWQGWDSWGVPSKSTDPVRSGDASLVVSTESHHSGNYTAQAYQDVTLVAGKTYQLSGWVYIPSADFSRVYLSVFDRGYGSYLLEADSYEGPSGGWMQMGPYVFTAPAGITSSYVHLVAWSDEIGSTCWWDDITLVPGELPPDPRGRFKQENLDAIRENGQDYSWGRSLYNSYIENNTNRYSHLSTDEIRGFISDLTPFRTVPCPNPECSSYGKTYWYVWAFEYPDTIRCKYCDERYTYDPEDTSEDWNIQGRLRYERNYYILNYVDMLALAHRVGGGLECGRRAATILRRFAECWNGWRIHHCNTHQFYDEPYKLAGKFCGWNYQGAQIIGKCAEAYELLRGSGLMTQEDRMFVEENLFRPALDFFRHPGSQLGFHDGRIGNDEPYIYTAIAKMGVALNDPEVTGWIVDQMQAIFNTDNGVFHDDGWWHEGAAGYHQMALGGFLELPEVLLGYRGLDPYKDARFAAFRNALSVPVRFMWPDGSQPPINDAHRSERSRSEVDLIYPETLLIRYQDADMLPLLEMLKETRGRSYWQSLLSLYNPVPSMAVSEPEPLESVIFPDIGYCVLRHGPNNPDQTVLTLDYGSYVGHGQFDNNSITLYAHGHEMAMDIGYLQEKYQRAWATTTLGHNTVTVDRKQQRQVTPQVPGDLALNFLTPRVQAVEGRGEKFYTETSMYRRLMAMIAIDSENCYVFDVFRVAGGNTHDWRLNSNSIIDPLSDNYVGMKVEELSGWQPWTAYDDYDIDYHGYKLPEYPSPIRSDNGARYATTSNDWSVEWLVDARDDVRYRMTMLDNAGAEIVQATAPGARDYTLSDSDRKMPIILVRKTKAFNRFVAIHEPIQGQSLIESVSLMSTVGGGVLSLAAEVVTSSGDRQWILSGAEPESRVKTEISDDNFLELNGQLGVFSKDQVAQPLFLYLGEGYSFSSDALEVEIKNGEKGNAYVQKLADNSWRAIADRPLTVSFYNWEPTRLSLRFHLPVEQTEQVSTQTLPGGGVTLDIVPPESGRYDVEISQTTRSVVPWVLY